jgi:DNA-binding NarL/FixJ family response regulator
VVKVRVLLIDSNDEARSSLAERLSRSTTVELLGQVRDTEEAGRILAGNDVDVMLVDLHRSDDEPATICHDLHRLAPAPVAVLTSFMRPERWESLRRAGAAAYLLKRVDSQELEQTLEQLGSVYRNEDKAAREDHS